MEDIETFIAAIEAGSQTAAARRLGRSLQSVNRSLVALEKSVGVELVRRTTRRSSATEAGLAFHRRVKPAVAEIGAARLEAASRRDEPSGLLRTSAAPSPAPPCAWCPRRPASAASSSSIAILQRSPSTSAACWTTAASTSSRARSFPTRAAAGDTSSTAPCSVTMALPSADDWQRHFGPAMPAFQAARRRYDPPGTLTPGYLPAPQA